MKKFILLILFLFLCFDVHAKQMGEVHGFHKLGLKPLQNTKHLTDKISLKFPTGMTYYKDFSVKNELNAISSLGSPIATFTNTSANTPVFDANGISMTVARDDVLRYSAINNRTGAQETIIIKITPTTTFANDGITRFITSSSTSGKDRQMRKGSATSVSFFTPNATDDISVQANYGIALQAGISYVLGGVCKQYSPYVETFRDGNSIATYTIGTFITNGFTANFFLGASNSGSQQLDGSISKVAFFNRALSSNEVLNVTNIFNNN